MIESGPRVVSPAPHARVLQYVDRACGKSTYVRREIKDTATPDERAKAEKEADRTAKNIRAVWARIVRIAADYGTDDVLVVTHKGVEDYIRLNLHIPANVRIEHHGATSGSNAHSAVRAAIFHGFSHPPDWALENAYEAQSGHPITVKGFATARREIALKEGGYVMVDQWVHADPEVERHRWQSSEAQLLQSIGRVRAALREDRNPVDVYILSDLALPELGPVEGHLYEDLEAGPDDRMISTAGIILENYGDRARCFPALWANENAAKQGAHRDQTVTSPYKKHIRGQSNHLPRPYVEVRYRRAVDRAGAATAIVAAEKLAGAQDWLTERLGPLALFEVVTHTPDAPDPEPAPGPSMETPVGDDFGADAFLVRATVGFGSVTP